MKNLKLDNKKNKKRVENFLAVAIATVVMLLGIYYIPIIIFLYPIPFIILGVKYEMKNNILGMIVSTIIIGLIVDKVSGIIILASYLPLSIVLNYNIKSRKKSIETIAISTLVLFMSSLLVLSIMDNMTGVSVITKLEGTFAQALEGQIEALKETELSSSDIFKINDFFENLYDYVLLVLPSTILIFSLITVYLNHLISVLILRKLGYGIVSVPRFSRFKLPNNILIGIGIMFLGTFLLKVFKLFYYKTIFLNLIFLVFFIFFVQGISVIDYKLIEKNTNGFFRIFIILFLIMILPLQGIITFMGVLDAFFDFRKLRESN